MVESDLSSLDSNENPMDDAEIEKTPFDMIKDMAD